MARLAQGVGLKPIAFNRSAIADPPVPMVTLDELLARSDIVSLHLGLNDATRGFLDRARLEKTKPGVIVVNTARAGVVDEPALIESCGPAMSATMPPTCSPRSRCRRTSRC